MSSWSSMRSTDLSTLDSGKLVLPWKWKWKWSLSVVPTLSDPMDCSPPGSSIHGIFQARVLEWVAIAFSRGIFPTQGSNPGLPHCRQMLLPFKPPGKSNLDYHNGTQIPRTLTMCAYKSIDFTIRKSGDLILALLKLSNSRQVSLPWRASDYF